MLDNLKKYHIILASNSPRRRELLGGLGFEFEVKVLPNIQEDYPAELPASQIAQYIASEKADAYRKSDIRNRYGGSKYCIYGFYKKSGIFENEFSS